MIIIKDKIRIALWIFIVYVFSFLCYTPMMLKKLGIEFPNMLTYLKYFFVIMPALVSIIFILCEQNLKKFLIGNFKKVSLKELFICMIIALVGIVTTFFYSFFGKIDLFTDSMVVFLINCVYLFITALIEEIAWRGFLLRNLFTKNKKIKVIIFVGVIWTIWHIPMWLIRNSLPILDILYLSIWTMLISIILGVLYYVYENIFSVALLHMIFNVCFLAPVKNNNIVIMFFSIVAIILFKNKKKISNST